MSDFSVKKAESDKRIAEYLTQAKQNSHSSIQYANATIEELENQNETLNSVEKHLDDQEEIIDQSLRKIRGMTWSGAFYNAYSDVVSSISSVASPISTGSNNGQSEKRSDPIPTPYEQKLFEKPPPVEMSEEDKLLDDISNAAAVLKQMGLSMGQQLVDQNEHLEKIEKKTDLVNDKTLAVSIKASQLTQKESKKDRYHGTFQFMNVSNSFLLCANGDNLELTNSADPSTLFQVILRQDTIVGLRNERTGKYVGITMWGSIAVSGNYFGSQEECFMELTGNDTGILFIAKNWGAGGWLKATNAPSTGESNPSTEVHIILNETTKSADDRTGRMILRAIRCQ